MPAGCSFLHSAGSQSHLSNEKEREFVSCCGLTNRKYRKREKFGGGGMALMLHVVSLMGVATATVDASNVLMVLLGLRNSNRRTHIYI